MADYYTQYSFEIENITPKERAWLELWIEEAEKDEEGSYLPDCLFGTRNDLCSLWLHDDLGGSNIDALANMLQSFLLFRPGQSITFSWANTCSKPRTDSFGGGAVFITRDDIAFMSTDGWIKKQKRKSHGS